jgi:hypothetical protein
LTKLGSSGLVPDETAEVYIADLYEAGRFAGREGLVFGWTVPSSSRAGPVIGAHKGRDEDFAISVLFPDTGEQEWFAPHLVMRID